MGKEVKTPEKELGGEGNMQSLVSVLLLISGELFAFSK